MANFVRRICCPGGSVSFIEPTDIKTSMAYRYRSTPAPVLEEIDDEPPTCERTAWHESGHAVIGHALGAEVEMVTIRAPARVVYAPGGELTPIQKIARSHAGPVGEMARVQCWCSGWPEDADEYLLRVQAFEFGGCDQCNMALEAWRAVGIISPIDAAREVMLAGQALALKLGQRRDVQQAIRALAAQLMEHGTISGKRAHSIIEPFVSFGEFKNDEENRAAS